MLCPRRVSLELNYITGVFAHMIRFKSAVFYLLSAAVFSLLDATDIPLARAQNFPDAPLTYEIIGLSIPLIERGRSRGVIRMDVWLEISSQTFIKELKANELRLRNGIVQNVSSALHQRRNTGRDIDLDLITERILLEVNKLFGDGHIKTVYFGRVIIQTR